MNHADIFEKTTPGRRPPGGAFLNDEQQGGQAGWVDKPRISILGGSEGCRRFVVLGKQEVQNKPHRGNETEQDTAGSFQSQINPTLYLPPLVCKKALASYAFPKFQRADLIREVRKIRNREKQDTTVIV